MPANASEWFVLGPEVGPGTIPKEKLDLFKPTIVSDYFSNLTRVKRHQAVYKVLSEELSNGVHALALHLFTADEWSSKEASPQNSPACLGGSKIDERA